MLNWHDPACRHPDVSFAGELPACLSCGNFGVLEESSSSQPQGSALEHPSSVKFDLCWPSSLPFIDEHHQAGQLGNSVSTSDGKASLPACGRKAAVQVQESEGANMALYEPLEAREIRTLELLPGDFDDPIRCTLRTVDLALKPEFEALSYTWADETGDASTSQRIYVGSRYDVLFVTANCANALRRLRFSKTSCRSRELWVDAICINQENTQERSRQVGIMKYIYATALRVLIYLGEDPGDPSPMSSGPWIYSNHGNTLDLHGDLSERSYFSRTWVIQEIASARSAWVLCGLRGARWQDFLYAARKNERRHAHPWLSLVAQPRHRELNELYGMLLATSKCKASDPRDKVFALLSLFVGANNAGLAADYSLSYAQVFAGTTAFILTQNPKDWHKLFAMIDSTRSSNLPSWTIDWFSPLTQSDSEPSHRITPSPSRSSGCKARFLRNGELVTRGHQLMNLGDCVIDGGVPTAKPSGIVNQVQYMPGFSFHEREACLRAVTWAQMDDKLFIVSGLRNHVLALRPLEGTDKHTFVAICDLPLFDHAANLVQNVDRRVMLLVSTWNEILGFRSSAWSRAKMWRHIKETCNLITHFWSLEQQSISKGTLGSSQGVPGRTTSKQQAMRSIAETSKSLELEQGRLNDLRTALYSREAIRKGALKRDSSSNVETLPRRRRESGLPKLEMARWRSWLGQTWMGEEMKTFLRQMLWDYGTTGSFNYDPRSFSRDGYIGRSVMWHSDYFRDPSLFSFRVLLGLEFGTHLMDETKHSLKWFADKILDQSLTGKTRALDNLLRHCTDKTTDGREDVLTMLWWMKNSLNIEPEVLSISDGKPQSSRGTWAASFMELWGSWSLGKETITEPTASNLADLGVEDASRTEAEDPAHPSSAKPSETSAGKASGDSMQSDTGVAMKSDVRDGVVNDLNADRVLFLEQSVDRKTWSILLDLVRETEQCLLPLEELFTARQFKTSAIKNSDKVRMISQHKPKWEDIHIV